jgi:hypothetical protein
MNPYFCFSRVFPVKTSCILGQGSLPGDRQGQKEGIEYWLVKPFPYQTACGKKNPGAFSLDLFI